MKKIVFFVLLLVCSIILCGCEIDDTNFPHLEYINSPFRYDVDTQLIKLPDGYVLNQGHPYDIVEADAGCDVIVHLIKEAV